MPQQTLMSEYTERKKEQEGTDELSGTEKSSLPSDLQGYLTQITAQKHYQSGHCGQNSHWVTVEIPP